MKINIIAEIGLNHLGNENYLYHYLNVLKKKRIDGISIQIPKKTKMLEKQKKFLFEDAVLKKFIKKAKKNFKIVGVTTSDESKIKFFSKQKINFFKVTSGMISNIKLIKKMSMTEIKKIYLSTGFSSYPEIRKILKNLKTKKIILIHTSFTNKIEEINMRRIKILKDKFNLPVSYGNHSSLIDTLTNSIFYEPESIFFYVKLNKKLNFPDNKHSINLNKIDNILQIIQKNIKISGFK